MEKILLIEDDVQLNEMLTMELTQHQYSVDSCYNGEDGLVCVSKYNYSLIILDRMLPDMEGASVLKKIRNASIYTPVFFLTALDSLQNKIDGFNAGADDYLTKPFHVEELLVRMRALMRRPVLDCSKYALNCNSDKVQLTKTEFSLLELFMKNPFKVFSREELLVCVWGSHAEVGAANVDNYIYFLRRHLKTLKSRTSIRTVYGIGYTLAEVPEGNRQL